MTEGLVALAFFFLSVYSPLQAEEVYKYNVEVAPLPADRLAEAHLGKGLIILDLEKIKSHPSSEWEKLQWVACTLVHEAEHLRLNTIHHHFVRKAEMECFESFMADSTTPFLTLLHGVAANDYLRSTPPPPTKGVVKFTCTGCS
jgi:hypothetical protein